MKSENMDPLMISSMKSERTYGRGSLLSFANQLGIGQAQPLGWPSQVAAEKASPGKERRSKPRMGP
jgi:hypothetical protein